MSAESTERTGNRRLWKGIMQLASGAAISQVVVFMTTPVLTRYYSPRDFGVAGLFLAFLLFLAPLSSLNYYQGIILPKNERDSLQLGKLSVTISLGFFLVFFISFFLFRPSFDVFFKMPELIPIFWLFPVAILVRSLYLILAAYMSRYRAFTAQTKARISQAVSERLISLVIGFAGYASSLAMVFSRFVSFVIETGILLFAFLRRQKMNDCEPPPRKSTGELAREYREFPLYSSWAMLLANGSGQLPLILLPLLFSPAVGGYYALGNRLFQLPLQLFGESIRNAYYKEVSDRIHQGLDNRESFQSLRNHLVAAGMFPFIFLLFFGDYIFGLLFGLEWAQAGAYAGTLGFFFFFQFISLPNICIFNAYKKQKYLVIISAALFVNSLVSLLLGAYFDSPTSGFAALTVNGIAIYMFMSYLAEKTIEAEHKLQFITYAKYLAYNSPFVLIFIMVKSMTENAVSVVVAGLFLSVCYYAVVYGRKLDRLIRNKGLA